MATLTTLQVPRKMDYEEVQTPPKPKLGGIFFWMVLGLALIKDLIVDPIALIPEGIGVITLVGIVVTVLVFFLKLGMTATVFAVSHFYYWTHGGLHTSAKIKRLVALILAFVVEAIPVADLLPMTTALFLAVAYWENVIRSNDLAAYLTNVADARTKA